MASQGDVGDKRQATKRKWLNIGKPIACLQRLYESCCKGRTRWQRCCAAARLVLQRAWCFTAFAIEKTIDWSVACGSLYSASKAFCQRVFSFICRIQSTLGKRSELDENEASAGLQPLHVAVWCDHSRPCSVEVSRVRSKSAPPPSRELRKISLHDGRSRQQPRSELLTLHDLKESHATVGRASSHKSISSSRSTPSPVPSSAGQSRNLRTRSVPRSGLYGDTPMLALQRLVPLRQPSRDSAHWPTSQSVLECFFVIGSDAHGKAETRQCWPKSLKGSQLEQVVVRDGFCPDPARFWRTASDGFGGQQFIFTLLETTLDDQADPSGLLYGCVCSAATSLKYDVYDDNPEPGEVLCIISKLPLFSFHFALLKAIRSRVDRAPDLLARVHAVGFNKGLVTQGIDLQGFPCGMSTLKLVLPQSPTAGLAIPSEQGVFPVSSVSNVFARFQASWGLELLLDQWGNLLGDTLARLVTCVLLEQKVLLIGAPACVSAMTLVLRGLVWPFRWLHPFLSAPPPSAFLRMPLLDATFPVILGLTEIPASWGFKTQYDLPSDVIVGMLSHDYVYTAPSHETSGGLKSADMKLPAGRHTAFLKQVAQAKQKLKKQEFSLQRAVEAVHDSMHAEIGKLVIVLDDYAAAQIAVVIADVEVVGTSVAGNANSDKFSARTLRELCFEQAARVDSFLNWLATEKPDELFGSTAASFYSTFFKTQLCLDYLHRRIASLIKERGFSRASHTC